ncbi:hypothetical protein FKW77_002518 [Venturia effusa]|uniref:Cell surface protein n=1 Tax=Venturia effusa TaxID=50376 RepID=A0A517LQT5_9PEZI|nr:hypothetical protein FKW77_002518 [Venturia effusa]
MLGAIVKHFRQRKDPSTSSTGSTNDLRMTPRSTVLFPLYIYPHPGAWEPLYEAITSHPDLKFLLVVNPHNGPGAFPLADSNYIREVARLNSIQNVCTIGYVKVDYCRRDLEEVYRDIETFSQWSEDYEKTGLGVHGIFLDEAPNAHSDHIGPYLENIGLKIKGIDGIMGDRIIIHNPGTTVDAKLAAADPGPDITAVVEESFEQYRSNSMQERLLLNRLDRSKCSYIVHTVPKDELKPLVHQLRKRGEYLFVTDLCADYYSQFGPGWREFIEAIVE